MEQRRAISAFVFGSIGLVIGLVYQANVGTSSKYESFLLLVTYWITPYLAVVITDYMLHRGRYPESVFYDTRHRNWKGVIAMLAGIIATVPFWDQRPPVTLGWVPTNAPQLGDLSFFAGAIVATVVYLVLYQLGRQSSSARTTRT